MKTKTIISTVLLIFVAVSLITLISRESGNDAVEESQSSDDNNVTSTKLLEDRVIVYYFHGNVRCQTCNTLEAYSKEAVETIFADDLKSGSVEWQVINFDETWNAHFLTDYDLSFQTLVLVEIKEGKEVSYKNLDKIWDLVKDKPAYLEYVKEELENSLTDL